MAILTLAVFTLISALQSTTSGQTCTLGRPQLPQSTTNPTPGLFIQEEGAAPCDGFISQWRVCYYNPSLTSRSSQFQILLEIWRDNELDNSLVSVGNLVAFITVPDQPASFQCTDVAQPPNRPIAVKEGDHLGVYIPSVDSVLPIINSGAAGGGTVYFAQVSTQIPFRVNRPNGREPRVTQLSDHAIHLSATVESNTPVEGTSPGGGEPPTFPNFNSSSSGVGGSSATTTDRDPFVAQSSPSGLSGGGVAAIVIVILIVIVGGVIGGVAAVVFVVRRRSEEDKLKGFPIDNAVYDTPELPSGSGSGTVRYDNMTLASSYEVPVSMCSHLAQNGTARGEVGRGGDTLERGFGDSFTTEYEYTQSGGEGEGGVAGQEVTATASEGTESACSSFNPYATLNPVVLQGYYNTFLNLQQNMDQEYSVPNAEGTGVEAPYREPPSNEEEIYKDLSVRTITIARHNVRIKKKIGKGAFSIVSQGVWSRGGVEYDVAVKELIQHSCDEDKIRLLQEAAIMGQFHHPNIVKLFGVIKHGNSPMLVTEVLHKGDLLRALHSLTPDPGQLVESTVPEVLLNYSQQVALGMHYLASKGFVHRDLAARNILVTRDDICKVGDFGLSRALADTDYYVSRGGVVPVRWTAPEAIFYRKYSSASDVWSYGCLLYEIWTMGMRPYEGIATNKYLETLQAGYRLPPPPGCPRVIYSIMIKCWNPSTTERPTFGQVLTTLLKDRNCTLTIPPADSASHPKAGLLFAGLEAGLEMYKDLQNLYVKAQASRSSSRAETLTGKSSQIRYSSGIQGEYETEDNGGSFGGEYEEEEEERHGSQNNLLSQDSPTRGKAQENHYDCVDDGSHL